MFKNCIKLLQQLKFTQQILRNEHKHIRKHKRVVNDPGIAKRKQLVDDDKEFEQLTDYEFDLEADFTNVAQTHKQYEHEQEFLKEREKYLIVRQKYFKEKLPNFLTWSDKEQIRYLHKTDPDEWTLERLSEGFPALPDVIAKVMKSTFTKSPNKVQNHDESVKANWKQFKDGKFNDLPGDLVEHLKKFTHRDLNLTLFETSEQVEITTNQNNRVGTEFVDIIKSYERLKNKDCNSGAVASSDFRSDHEEVGLLGPKRSTHKHMTLEMFKEELEKDSPAGKAELDEKLILKSVESEESSFVNENYLDAFVSDDNTVELKEGHAGETPVADTSLEHCDKYKKQEVAITSNKMNGFDLVEYPERIRIPKRFYKSGHTFKVNDCYYDDDGEFLYRVPGMDK